MRYRADANQNEIVSQLRDCGVSVEVLSQVGKAFPDLLVGFRGKNYLMEVKGEDGELSADQVKWHFEWNGQVCVVRTFGEALAVLEDGTAIELISQALKGE